MTRIIGEEVETLHGFAVGDVCIVKNGNFKNMEVKIFSLRMNQFGQMKEPTPYAYATFPNGNCWNFQCKNLRKI